MRDLFLESLSDAGFWESPRYQNPEALSWVAVALRALGAEEVLQERCRERLKPFQTEEGSVVFSRNYPAAFWTTPLALFAWGEHPAYQQETARAKEFLLNTTGVHRVNTAPEILSHDTNLKGWPYIEKTHSWTEPTSLALIALAQFGVVGHARCKEGRLMLMNRQLSKGGWNTGNVKTYGTELEPLPESTGIVLEALAGHVLKDEVELSLAYLTKWLEKGRTPLTLSYGLMGLSAWNARPENADAMLQESWQRYETSYRSDLTLFSMLILASVARQGLLHSLKA